MSDNPYRLCKEKGAEWRLDLRLSGFQRPCLVPCLVQSQSSVSATVISHRQGSGFPKKVTVGLRSEKAPLLLRGSEGKAEAKWIPGAACEEGPFWKSQVEKGVALFGVLIFQFPGAKGILGPFSSPKRPRGNSSNLASDSPSPVPGERSDSRGAFQGPPLERLPASASGVSIPCWGKQGIPGDADHLLLALRPMDSQPVFLNNVPIYRWVNWAP